MANTTAAIMAIPAPLENIRLVGDEEKHATLLFFGETSTLPDDAKNTLVESVKMACNMLFPFTERLREIARLGNDVPPALVAKLSDECLSQIRNLFMMNPAVNRYLDNAQQFPSFTPHVTLGYPDYTEEAILRTLAAQLYRIRFDRLAIWWNDERIEFKFDRLLDGPESDMAHAVLEFLEEYGEAIEHADVSNKPWSNFKESDYDDAQWLRACLIDRGLNSGTAKQRGSLPVREPDGTLNRNAVHAAAGALAGARGGIKASPELLASAKKKLKALYSTLEEDAPESLKHSEMMQVIESSEDDAEQAGVKGMKWGVRRRVDPKTGLVSRTASADQIHVDRITKKLGSGGVSALSNKDLQDFSTRIQRQQEFNRALSSQEAQRSKPFIQRFLATQGKRQFTRVTDKAIDIAVEKALQQAGIQIGKKGGRAKDVADILTETGVRLKPKKKGNG